MADTVKIVVHLTCFVRQEPDGWLAGCPHLDVFSQGDSAEDAKAALSEAVELWVESCLERNTFAKAMAELGWHRTSGPSKGGSYVGLEVEPAESVLGEPFPIEVTIPAYQAAALIECASS